MKISFHLNWIESAAASPKDFKLPGTRSLFFDYLDRIKNFSTLQACGKPKAPQIHQPATVLWLCNRSKNARMFSSEDLTAHLEKLQNGGIRSWHIVIGGPDGFSKKDVDTLQPAVEWSFGPMTYPHELAAVIAAEQVYRAWAIIKNLPYHAGH